MPSDHQHNPDPNENAARIVEEAIQVLGVDESACDVESAWKAWSVQIPAVDERGLVLLHAAFEAGWYAGLQVKKDRA